MREATAAGVDQRWAAATESGIGHPQSVSPPGYSFGQSDGRDQFGHCGDRSSRHAILLAREARPAAPRTQSLCLRPSVRFGPARVGVATRMRNIFSGRHAARALNAGLPIFGRGRAFSVASSREYRARIISSPIDVPRVIAKLLINPVPRGAGKMVGAARFELATSTSRT